MQRIIWLSILITTLNSCINHRNDFKYFLNLLTMDINSHNLKSFKNSDILDIDQSEFNLVFNEIKKSINQLDNASKIAQMLDSISFSDIDKTFYVSIALHRMLNHKSVSMLNVLPDYRKFNYYRKGNLELPHFNKLNRIVKENDKLFNTGDTISALFRIDEDFGLKIITYNNLVSDSVYYAFENTVKLRCILIRKIRNKSTSQFNKSNELEFRCRIVDINKENVFVSNQKELEVGSNIDISIFSYGRLLGRSNDYVNW